MTKLFENNLFEVVADKQGGQYRVINKLSGVVDYVETNYVDAMRKAVVDNNIVNDITSSNSTYGKWPTAATNTTKAN